MNRVAGANDRIAVGYIGIGGPPSNTPGMGLAHVRSQKQFAARYNLAQAAVCDLYSRRNDLAKQAIGDARVTAYDDYRKLLERKDIDAVVVSTHDVWHARVSIDALEAGKHVYCEKPLTRYLGEAFNVHDAVKRTGKIFQIGVQSCSASAWHKAAQLIKAGKVGKVIWGQGYYCRNNPMGEWNYALDSGATPETVKWDTWLGPVKHKVPFSAEHFFRWRKFYPYGAGLLGDLAPHRLHPLMLAAGNLEFPKRVVCLGAKSIHPDEQTPGAREREVPEHLQLLAEFPSGLTLMVAASTVNTKSPGFVICGHKATLELGAVGDRLALVPEKAFAGEITSETLSGKKLEPNENVSAHEQNWFDCIRSNQPPNGNIDLALRVQTVISLAEMSERMNLCCLFDEPTRRITTGDGRPVEPLSYETERS